MASVVAFTVVRVPRSPAGRAASGRCGGESRADARGGPGAGRGPRRRGRGEVVRARSIGHAILEEAESRNADLIVVGSSHAGGASRGSSRRPSTYVLRERRARCSSSRSPRACSGVTTRREGRGHRMRPGGFGGRERARERRLGRVRRGRERGRAPRLGPGWRGGFVLGHGMDITVLDGRASRRRTPPSSRPPATTRTSSSDRCCRSGTASELVVVRVLDPARARVLRRARAQTVCPTQTAISVLLETVRGDCALNPSRGELMYVIVAGGGKVGANSTRSLLEMGHEVTLVEQRPTGSRGSRRSSARSPCAATRPRSTSSSGRASRGRPSSCSP